MRRRVVHQASQDKHRPIDNAKSNSANSMSFLSESITVVPVDIAAHNAVWIARKAGRPLYDDWQLELGSEDQGEAYRGVPNAHH